MKQLSPAQQVQYLTEIAKETLIDNSEKIEENQLLLKEIREAVRPKKKKKHKKLPERDAIPFSIYERIQNSKKPKHMQHLSWSRFKIATTILFFTGIRVSESASITKEQIDVLLDKGECQIYQSKVDSYKTIHLPELAHSFFTKLQQDLNRVYVEPEDILCPHIETSRHKWDTQVNEALQPFAEGLNIKSHSFRISYVTKILKYSSVDRAQAFVGHKDIRSTMHYNRYLHGSTEDLKKLNEAFNAKD